MKKLLILLFAVLSLSAFADTVSLVPDVPLKPQIPWTDDTGTLQALLTAGAGSTVTLSVATYHTSASLIVPANTNFQLSGSFIISSQTTGAAVKLNAGAEIQGGTVQGQWVYTTLGSPTGASGIQLLGSNTTVYNMRVLGYSSYGIVCFFAANNVSVTHNEITKTGYIGFYYDSEATTSTGNFSYNNVDRSMIAPSTVIEAGVSIRGAQSTTVGTFTSGWTIANNTISMPLNPTNITAECMEVRFMNNSTISNNTFFQGSIGASLVFDKLITLTSNRLTNQSQENIEIDASATCSSNHDYASGANAQGSIFLDGWLSTKPLQHSTNISLNYDTVRSPSLAAVRCYFGTTKVYVNNCNFTAGTYGIYLQRADTISTVNTIITGHTGSSGFYFENAIGNTTIANGAIVSCTNAVKAYNTNTSAVVDNIVGTNVNLSGTINKFGSYFLNGAHYGSNVRFTNSTFSFPVLVGVTYGTPNFVPGAISNLAITYSSDNTAIATIVSGLIHITGTGTVNITATTSDTSASQPLVISKKALTVTPQNKTKTQGTANPTLTVTYSSFAYGETNSVFTTQPTIATTALTGSPVGAYPITASGAAAANYTFTYGTPAVLSVFGSDVYGPFFTKHIVY